MNKTAHTLARQFALLLEQCSEKDFAEAIEILRDNGIPREQVKDLSAASRYVKKNGSQSVKGTSPNGHKQKPLDQVTSQAVRSLEKKDPEKYRVLLVFDRAVRKGEVLVNNSELRRFGYAIDKNFSKRKSRKDYISAVMSALAAKPLSNIKGHVQKAMDGAYAHSPDGYQNLARFIIEGRAHA